LPLLPPLLPSFLHLFLVCQSPSVGSQGVGGGDEDLYFKESGGGDFSAGLPSTLAPVPQIPQEFVGRNYYSPNNAINHASEAEERLLRDKLAYYNKLIRPVNNLTHPVHVQFGMSMVQLISVNEKDQIMKSNVWLRMSWQDPQLAWDKGDYGGLESIRLPPDFVWVPDIVLYNNADGKYEVSFKCNVVIEYTGAVLWIPPALYKSSCTIDVEYFPFDEQICLMKFGSWTFNGDQVELGWYMNKPYIDLSDYVYSGTWDIIKGPGSLNVYNATEEKPKLTDITFHIVIRRKTLFYTVNLIIPCVLISFLSVFVFYLPSDAGEKMTLCISILLGLMVFLLLVSKILPATSEVIPLIAKYLLFTFIMNILTILVTVIIINWSFRTPATHKMPAWVRFVFLNFLPRILFMKRPEHKPPLATIIGNGAIPNMMNNSSNDVSTSASLLNRRTAGKSRNDEDEACSNRGRNRFGGAYGVGSSTPTSHLSVINSLRWQSEEAVEETPTTFAPEIHRAAESVRFIAQRIVSKDSYNQVKQDWKYVALVIDRLQLYIFFAVTLGWTIDLLIDAPHIFEYVDQQQIISQLSEGSS